MQDAHREQLARMSAELDEAERAHLREQEAVASLKMELSAAAHAAELMSKERDDALELHKESRDLLIQLKADHDAMIAGSTGAPVLPHHSPPRAPSPHHARAVQEAHHAQQAAAAAAHQVAHEQVHHAVMHGAPPPRPPINPQNANLAAERLRAIQERGQRILQDHRGGR